MEKIESVAGTTRASERAARAPTRADASPSPSQVRIPRVLEPGDRYEGLLSFRGDVRLDGTLDGEILGFGTLWIGERAHVDARVEADSLIVAGCVKGEIIARDRIELLRTARVEGAIEAPRIVLNEGSIMQGRCRAGATSPAPRSRRKSA